MSDHEKAIRAALKEKRMTIKELSEGMEVTPAAVSNLMSRDARMSSINKAAQALGIKTSTLLRKGE
jgi:transcriptional regulator with XRE-family HTH domain